SVPFFCHSLSSPHRWRGDATARVGRERPVVHLGDEPAEANRPRSAEQCGVGPARGGEMTKGWMAAALGLLLIAGVAEAQRPEERGWKRVSDQDGVRVWVREVPGEVATVR